MGSMFRASCYLTRSPLRCTRSQAWQPIRSASNGKLKIDYHNRSLSLIHEEVAAKSELISPTFLKRARSMAAEHDILSRQLVEGFDKVKAKRVGELSSTADALKGYEASKDVSFANII